MKVDPGNAVNAVAIVRQMASSNPRHRHRMYNEGDTGYTSNCFICLALGWVGVIDVDRDLKQNAHDEEEIR